MAPRRRTDRDRAGRPVTATAGERLSDEPTGSQPNPEAAQSDSAAADGTQSDTPDRAAPASAGSARSDAPTGNTEARDGQSAASARRRPAGADDRSPATSNPVGPGQADARPGRRLLGFLGLLLVLTLPFWALDLFADRLADWLPENLPASALMIVAPAVAAAILIGRRDGRTGLVRWLRRVADATRVGGIGRWTVVLLAMPTTYLLAWLTMRLFDVPLPNFTADPATVAILLAAYFLAAAAEELGWTAYATDALLPWWGRWRTGVVLGIAWAVWHLPGFISGGNSAWWVLWQCLFTVALRTAIVSVYAWTGHSVFAAVAVHAMSNVSWNLFPADGSGYDPLYTTIVVAAVLLGVGGFRSRRPRRSMVRRGR